MKSSNGYFYLSRNVSVLIPFKFIIIERSFYRCSFWIFELFNFRGFRIHIFEARLIKFEETW